VDDAQEELYVGCKGFTILNFTIQLYFLKCFNGWNKFSFTGLIKTLREVFLFVKIIKSFREAKSMVSNVGLDHKWPDVQIVACHIEKKHEKDKYCHVFEVSR